MLLTERFIYKLLKTHRDEQLQNTVIMLYIIYYTLCTYFWPTLYKLL
jgi:hypothetical protein